MTRARLAVAAVLAFAAPAAASWNPPTAFDKPSSATCGGRDVFNCLLEPHPRVALNARGDAVAAWLDARGRIRAALARRGGRFGTAQTLGRGLQPGVAIAPDGTATVVWGQRDGLHYARGARRFGRARALVAPATKLGDSNPRLAAQPGGAVVVTFESAYRTAHGAFHRRLSALTITRSGRRGTVTRLGDAFVNHDSFRAVASGEAAVCCFGTDRRIAQLRPGAGWRMLSSGLGVDYGLETVGPGRGQVAVGAIATTRGGDAGLLGVPGVLRIDAAGAAGPLRPAPVDRPTRGLQPVVAIGGAGRDVLVYQEKAQPAAFSRTAPVYAVVGNATFATRQTLDITRAYHPLLRATGSGSVAAWESGDSRWRVAVERDGVFRNVAAPRGSISLAGEDFHYNRDLAANGSYAALVWVDDSGAIRASVGTP